MVNLSYCESASRAICIGNSPRFVALLKSRIGAPITGNDAAMAENFARLALELEARIQASDTSNSGCCHYVRLRAIWFDHKNSGMTVHVDYLHDSSVAALVQNEDIERHMGHESGHDFCEGQMPCIAVRIKPISAASDWFHPDGDDFYDIKLKELADW